MKASATMAAMKDKATAILAIGTPSAVFTRGGVVSLLKTFDEPRLQHSTAKCTAKPKNDPNNKDERRLQGFFHCRSKEPVPGYTLGP